MLAEEKERSEDDDPVVRREWWKVKEWGARSDELDAVRDVPKMKSCLDGNGVFSVPIELARGLRTMEDSIVRGAQTDDPTRS